MIILPSARQFPNSYLSWVWLKQGNCIKGFKMSTLFCMQTIHQGYMTVDSGFISRPDFENIRTLCRDRYNISFLFYYRVECKSVITTLKYRVHRRMQIFERIVLLQVILKTRKNTRQISKCPPILHVKPNVRVIGQVNSLCPV